MALAAFMEVLDTSIANVALPHISGGLGASQDQGTWVLTTYLVANAIVLPTSGWLTEIVGRKRLFMICIALFTASSVLCGLAPSLPILLMARAFQGAGGGGLQPMAQAIMADVFPPEKRGQAFALYGLTAVVAPALGPTLGGWITDSFSWRWIFLINLPVGLAALALTAQLVEDPPFLRRRKLGEARFDYLGFSALVLGVSALQILLDKGQEDDWFGSHFIVALICIALVGLSFLAVWEWFDPDPIVDVRLFRFASFSTSSIMMFLVGVVAFTATILMPQFLQGLMGYTAEKAGLVVSSGAALLLVEMPLIGILTTKVPIKYLLATGWGLAVCGLYFSVKHMSLGVSFGEASLIMAVQYVPLGFIFIPATTAAYFGVPQDKSSSVSGLINFMRNIGSSVGTSATTTILAQREQFHQVRLASNAVLGNWNFDSFVTNTANSLKALSAGVGGADAQQSALARAYQTIQQQAGVLSYIDAYFLIGGAAGVMLLLSFFVKRNDPKHTEVAAGH